MPKPLSYKEVVRRLKDYDGRTRIKQQSGKFDAVNESHIFRRRRRRLYRPLEPGGLPLMAINQSEHDSWAEG